MFFPIILKVSATVSLPWLFLCFSQEAQGKDRVFVWLDFLLLLFLRS